MRMEAELGGVVDQPISGQAKGVGGLGLSEAVMAPHLEVAFSHRQVDVARSHPPTSAVATSIFAPNLLSHPKALLAAVSQGSARRRGHR